MPSQAATRWFTDRQGAPIQWQAWGQDAISRSVREGRPIFLSIGYASSNACYRMHREAFLNGEIAEAMNAYFVPVLLDRIEHPEIAEAYETILRSMGVEPGCPSNLILTSTLEPFAGAGSLRPDELNRMLVIQANRWANERPAVLAEARANLEKAKALGEKRLPGEVDAAAFDGIAESLARRHDAGEQLDAMAVTFLFHYARRAKQEVMRNTAFQALRRLATSPAHDHLGGGFHRSDTAYEKMLPDQALLARAFMQGAQITGDKDMEDVARHALDYVIRDMRAPRTAFFASQDAHSLVPGQGPEFVNAVVYHWKTDEIARLLGHETAGKVFALYGMKEELSNRTVVRDPAHLRESYTTLAEPLAKMLDVRSKRPAPFREWSLIAGWNGLMISALARGGAAFGEPRYVEAAVYAATEISSKHWKPATKTLTRTDAGGEALAEDYALLIQGLLDLFEATYDPKWLGLARTLQERQDALFWDAGTGRYATGATLPAALRGLTREMDQETPAASSVSAANLLRLAALTGNEKWRAQAGMIFQSFGGRLRNGGHELAALATAWELSLAEPSIVVVTGEFSMEETRNLLRSTQARWEPMRAVVFLPVRGPARERVTRALPFTAALKSDPKIPRMFVCSKGECR